MQELLGHRPITITQIYDKWRRSTSAHKTLDGAAGGIVSFSENGRKLMKALEIAGAIASISSWVIVIYFQWQGDGATQRNVALFTGMIFLALIVLNRLRRKTGDTLADPGYKTQSGIIDLTTWKDKEYEVYYPLPFSGVPNLTLRALSGTWS